MTEKMIKNQELIKNAYAAFNARDINAIPQSYASGNKMAKGTGR